MFCLAFQNEKIYQKLPLNSSHHRLVPFFMYGIPLLIIFLITNTCILHWLVHNYIKVHTAFSSQYFIYKPQPGQSAQGLQWMPAVTCVKWRVGGCLSVITFSKYFVGCALCLCSAHCSFQGICQLVKGNGFELIVNVVLKCHVLLRQDGIPLQMENG